MDSNDPLRPEPDGLPNSSGPGLETLIRFDELHPTELAALKAEPSAARAIAMMEAAEAYLESGGLAESVVSADELYAYGAGPGASDLAASRRETVKRHLSANPTENAWVEGLKVAPPSPLILDRDGSAASRALPAERKTHLRVVGASAPTSAAPTSGAPTSAAPTSGAPTSGAPEPAQAPGPSQRGVTSIAPPVPAVRPIAASVDPGVDSGTNSGVNWMVWSPLAAAALVLAMALGGGARPSALDGALPDSPILRSGSQAGLLFPRGRVLSAAAPSGAFAARPHFEIAPTSEASLFRYELRRLDPVDSMDAGSALFEAGESLWTIESKNRTVTANPLNPGAYEWTAWETIDGLDRELGTMTFQVVEDPAWSTAALEPDGANETVIRERVRLLHANGYLTDARRLVRALPTSSERSSYLSGQ